MTTERPQFTIIFRGPPTENPDGTVHGNVNWDATKAGVDRLIGAEVARERDVLLSMLRDYVDEHQRGAISNLNPNDKVLFLDATDLKEFLTMLRNLDKCVCMETNSRNCPVHQNGKRDEV